MLIWLTIVPFVLMMIMLLWGGLSFLKPTSKQKQNAHQPFVSVIVAARDEEAYLEKSLLALTAQTYANYDIWVGNDASSDRTLEVASRAADHDQRIHVVDVTQQKGSAQGKSNVLAQLIQRSKGELILVTDADTAVNSQWIEQMVGAFEKNTGVVTGVTAIKSRSLFGCLQGIDWMYAIFLMYTASLIGLPVTAMGNNMAFRREAYLQTGGYEALPFSVTEDFQLFFAIRKQGWGFKNIFDASVLAFTHPLPSLKSLLHQRKRWMRGAMQLPWHFKGVLFLEAIYYPVLLIIVFKFPGLASGLAIVKLTVQAGFIWRGYHLLNLSVAWWKLWLFELYSMLLTFALLVFYFIPIKITWKNRTYQ